MFLSAGFHSCCSTIPGSSPSPAPAAALPPGTLAADSSTTTVTVLSLTGHRHTEATSVPLNPHSLPLAGTVPIVTYYAGCTLFARVVWGTDRMGATSGCVLPPSFNSNKSLQIAFTASAALSRQGL